MKQASKIHAVIMDLLVLLEKEAERWLSHEAHIGLQRLRDTAQAQMARHVAAEALKAAQSVTAPVPVVTTRKPRAAKEILDGKE